MSKAAREQQRSIHESWFPEHHAPDKQGRYSYRGRIRRMAGLCKVSNFDLELSLIRAWDMLHSNPSPRWKWFQEYGTELWQHRLACMCAWSDTFEWNPWAEKIMEACHKVYSEDKKLVNIIGSQNCLGEDELVRMWDGTVRPIKDVHVGDLVLGDDREPRVVKEKFEGEAPLYRITPKIGRSWTCTGNHRLVLKCTSARKPHGRNKSGVKRPRKKARRRSGDTMTITVEDYLKKTPDFKTRNLQYSAQANDDNGALTIDPRLYGLWLGDGRSGQPTLIVSNEEKEVLKYMYSVHDNFSVNGSGPNCPEYRLRNHPQLCKIAKRSVETGEKRIVPEAFRMHRFNRLLLLAGLLDSDGHLSNNCQFIFTQKKIGLAKDVMELAQGLGFRCSFKKKFVKCTNGNDPNKLHPSHDVVICGDIDMIPTLRKRRAKGPAEGKRRKHGCTGIDVAEEGVGNYVGITVDGNHRFCLDDYTVVSNSGKTETMAHFIVQLLIEDPDNVAIYIGSPYKDATSRGIWGNVQQAFKCACAHLGWDAEAYLVRSKDKLELQDSDVSGWIRVVAVDRVAMLQGKKPKSKTGWLYLFVEESGLFEKTAGNALWEQMQNLFGQDRFKCFTNCNFKSVFGLDGTLCKPAKGTYTDLDVDKDQSWDSIGDGYTLRLDGHLSPNRGLKKKKYSYLVGDKDAKAMIARGNGKKSAKYMEQIRSMPVTGMSTFTVTTLTRLQAGKTFANSLYLPSKTNRWAFADPSLGGDASIVAIADIKTLNTGQPAIVPVGLVPLDIVHSKEWTEEDIMELDLLSGPQMEIRVGDKYTPEMQGAMQTAVILRDNGIPQNQFGYDASMRASVQRAMTLLIGTQCLAIDYMGYPPDTQMPSGIGAADKLYANFNTYLWFLAADMAENYAVREGDKWIEAFNQLSDRQWEWVGGKKKMENKDDYKSRNGQKSPDEGDAVVGLLYLIFLRSGLFGMRRQVKDGADINDWLLKRAARMVQRRRLGEEAAFQMSTMEQRPIRRMSRR